MRVPRRLPRVRENFIAFRESVRRIIIGKTGPRTDMAAFKAAPGNFEIRSNRTADALPIPEGAWPAVISDFRLDRYTLVYQYTFAYTKDYPTNLCEY